MKIKVKFNTSIVFGEPNLSFALNSVAEIEEKLVLTLLENGIAERVADNIPVGARINGDNPDEWRPQPIVEDVEKEIKEEIEKEVVEKPKKTTSKKKNEKSVE